MNSFSRNVDLLHRTMDANTLRYQVSADNITKSGLPNFKRTAVNFEAELKRALDSEKQAKNDTFPVKWTDARHFKGPEAIDYRTVEPRRVTDYATTSMANGGNFDAEQEAQNILKIQLNYKLLARMQSFEFQQIRTAIRK